MTLERAPLTGRGRLVLDLPGEVTLEEVIKWSRGIGVVPLPWELWGWKAHPTGAETWECLAKGRLDP